MTKDIRQIIYILLCISLLFAMLYTVKDKEMDYSVSKKGFSYLFKNYRIYLGNILWVKVDEFFHISNTMEKKDFIELSELAFKLNPHNAYYTSITILHIANTGNYVKHAISLGQEFINKNPKNPDTHKILGALGWLYIKQKEYSDAESALTTALNIVDRADINMVEDYGEFLFPLNYINMLELVYKQTDQTEKEQKLSLLKESIKEAGYIFPDIKESKQNKQEHHHHHSHDNMRFIWQRLSNEKFQHKEEKKHNI